MKPGRLILFQGDSVTDCGRDRGQENSLGGGYPALVAEQLKERHPGQEIRFTNRAVSGERSRDLVARWDGDCIRLRPDVVSILVGINDTWRRYDQNDPTSAEEFEHNCRILLQRTKTETTARILLLEPFLLQVRSDQAAWREDLNPKIDVVRRLAIEFGAFLIPLDGLFSSAACVKPPTHWTADGVHPSAEGHRLIAQAWIKAYGALPEDWFDPAQA